MTSQPLERILSWRERSLNGESIRAISRSERVGYQTVTRAFASIGYASKNTPNSNRANADLDLPWGSLEGEMSDQEWFAIPLGHDASSLHQDEKPRPQLAPIAGLNWHKVRKA